MKRGPPRCKMWACACGAGLIKRGGPKKQCPECEWIKRKAREAARQRAKYREKKQGDSNAGPIKS